MLPVISGVLIGAGIMGVTTIHAAYGWFVVLGIVGTVAQWIVDNYD